MIYIYVCVCLCMYTHTHVYIFCSCPVSLGYIPKSDSWVSLFLNLYNSLKFYTQVSKILVDKKPFVIRIVYHRNNQYKL